MSEKETMNGLSWIPTTKANDISIENTKRIKPRSSTKLKLKDISTKEYISKIMVLHFRILEPNSLNSVNQDMYGKGITETNLLFWYKVNDAEFVLKVSSQNCKCYVGFEKGVELSIDVELTRHTTKKTMSIHVYYKT